MFRARSLRTQLFVLGLGAVLLPLLMLFGVVVLTTSSEEVEDQSGPAAETGAPFAGTDSSTSSVPIEVILAAVLLALAGGTAVWVWSGRAIRPMATITSVANEIQGGSLDRRIDLHGAAAEVQALGDSFDQMLDRLSHASATQQRLIEDTSHELRTPLAALAVNNEVIIRNPDPTLEDYRASAERGEALIARLQLTIDDLLRGARAQTHATQQVDNDLMAIVAKVVAQHRAVNPNIPSVVRGPTELHLGIDGPSVQRALVNLLENAARYSPPGAPVTIEVSTGAAVHLSVTDHGPGIAPEDRDRIFDRYYRSDADPESGAGIGLALVKQVADAHGGIEVLSPVPGDDHGTRFTLMFAAPPT